MVLVSVIIVNWNSTGYLRECIRSIYEYAAGLAVEIIVVDNASPVDDVETLRSEFPKISLIRSSSNLGFGAANNVGYAHSSGQCLLFLNPDTRLIGPAIATLFECLQQRPAAGIAGCKLLNGDLTIQTSCIQRFPTILNQIFDTDALRKRWPKLRLWGTAPLYSATPRPVAVEVVSGACLMIKREVFAKVGCFTPDYFMYGEDLDLCHKVIHAGFKNIYSGDCAVIHYGGGSSVPNSATKMKWTAIIQFLARTRGAVYALVFRAVMVSVATGRLALIKIGLAICWPKGSGRYSSYDKWQVILNTLIRYSHARRTCRLADQSENVA